VIGGSVIWQHDGHFFNTYQLFVPGREEPYTYEKTHLFRQLSEDSYFFPGERLTTVDLPWGKTGLAICYDLRFPELVRAYANRGIDCLLVAAQWGAKRSDHWRTLLKARAIENQMFILASNAVGPIGDDPLAGFSAIIDPWGKLLAEAGADQPALLTAELDSGEITRIQQMVTSKMDTRPELYRAWNEKNRSD
jgi:predicted amidohydrolase